MSSDAERRLRARGVELVEWDLGRHDEPDVVGCLVLYPREHSAVVHVMGRAGLTTEQRRGFAEWVEEKIDRYLRAWA